MLIHLMLYWGSSAHVFIHLLLSWGAVLICSFICCSIGEQCSYADSSAALSGKSAHMLIHELLYWGSSAHAHSSGVQ